MPGPQNTPKPAVLVYYDSRGQRLGKLFADAYKAHSFYSKKMKEGKNPQVRKAE